MKPELFLRWGLAFSFIYVAISGFLNPESWIGFVPDLGIIEKSLALNIHLAFDAVLGIWLLSNKKIYYAAILSSLNLFLITLVNMASIEIVFRDISLFFMALALVFMSKK